MAKLLALSRSCHHALHEGVWTATLHPDNTVTFTVPFGQTLQRAPP
ncbi:MAG TPA: hypothetical protein VHF25_15105 [Nitriliruptorales bacterium]|nr:hypothetical protein [Nitriliruptorales bacterium]